MQTADDSASADSGFRRLRDTHAALCCSVGAGLAGRVGVSSSERGRLSSRLRLGFAPRPEHFDSASLFTALPACPCPSRRREVQPFAARFAFAAASIFFTPATT